MGTKLLEACNSQQPAVAFEAFRHLQARFQKKHHSIYASSLFASAFGTAHGDTHGLDKHTAPLADKHKNGK
jgi:hypothetical protein